MSTATVTGLEAQLNDFGLKTPIPPFPAADVLKRPLDIGRSYFADILCSLLGCDPATAFNSIQWPNNIENGDLAAVLPKLDKSSNQNVLGFDLTSKFPKCPLFMKPFADGAHLRIFFEARTLPRLLLPFINDRKTSYGRDVSTGLHDCHSPDLGHKKLVIEFSSPNIASEFQGKHLRSTILGAHIANLYESMGWDVVRINYLGDWGKPIGLLGAGWEKFGSEESFQNDPVGTIRGIYEKTYDLFEPEQVASKKARDEKKDTAEIESQGWFAERNAYFKRMEDGDEKAIAFWQRVRDVNIEDYTKLYRRLNVSFDEYSGESQVTPEAMAEVEEILEQKGLCEDKEGSRVIDLKKHTGKAGMAIIRDRTGSSTYLLRDIAAVLTRAKKYSFDQMIYVVAADHKDHFTRLFKILELMDMPDLAAKLQHVNFSQVSRMAENLGRGHMLGEILDQCEAAMRESLQQNPEKASLLGEPDKAAATIGINALLAQEASARRANDHSFAITQMASFEPGTGPDLQYWYARLCSTLKSSPAQVELSGEEFASPDDVGYVYLLRLLAIYPDIINSTYKSLEPATIMAYVASVTGLLSECFEDHDGEDPSPAQLMLYEATRIVLESAMKLVGIVPVIE